MSTKHVYGPDYEPRVQACEAYVINLPSRGIFLAMKNFSNSWVFYRHDTFGWEASGFEDGLL